MSVRGNVICMSMNITEIEWNERVRVDDIGNDRGAPALTNMATVADRRENIRCPSMVMAHQCPPLR